MKSEDLDENLSPLEAGASPSQPGVSELNSAEQISKFCSSAEFE